MVSISIITVTGWNIDLSQQIIVNPFRRCTIVFGAGIYIVSDLVLTGLILRIVFQLYSNFLNETSSEQHSISSETQRQRKFRRLIPWTLSCVVAMGIAIIIGLVVVISPDYHSM
jgi:hypothetical protein